MVQTRFALILFFSMVTHKAACHAPNSVGGSFGTARCWRYFSHRILRLKICPVVLHGYEPAYSSAIISLVWGLSLFKITFSTTNEADNNSYMGCLLLELSEWCKIQSLIFNKGVVVKQLEISMASLITAINNFDVSYFIPMIFAYLSETSKNS